MQITLRQQLSILKFVLLNSLIVLLSWSLVNSGLTMGMTVELPHSVHVFYLLSSHLPNVGILYIKLKLNITAV